MKMTRRPFTHFLMVAQALLLKAGFEMAGSKGNHRL